jgi:hypothetical protein
MTRISYTDNFFNIVHPGLQDDYNSLSKNLAEQRGIQRNRDWDHWKSWGSKQAFY